MKSSRSRFSIAALALFVFILGLGSSAPASTPKPPVTIDDRNLIKSVDVKNSSVVIQFMRDKTVHPYKIDAMTAVKVNNQDGKVDGIKPGMVVDDYQERYSDTLDTLNVSGYGTTPVAAKPKAAKKAAPKPATSSSSSGSSQ